MIQSVDLGKRPEAYVRFAFWCLEHNISGRRAAECIELCIQAKRNHLTKHYGLLDQVTIRLELSGMTDIRFEEGWPSFYCPATGDRTQFPMKEFI